MAIYRGAGGSGDAVEDSASEAILTVQARDAAIAAEIAAETAQAAAQTSATNASNSASAASTSATNASNSASAASTSATNAATSASAASTSATNAAASSSSASTSATNATSSASSASTSASNASTSASNASTSATNSSNSASSASTSATNASNSASSAATSATNAANSATLAASYTPSQTGNSGKYLTTNGTATSWDTLDTGDISGLGTIATQNANAVAITGGTINGTTIGATTPSTGVFSDLTDSSLTSGRVTYAGTGGNLRDASNFTYDGTNLVAGAIQNTPIGATTPSSVNATTITGQTGVLRGTGTNLLTYSQAFNDASWTKQRTTATADSTTAPDGTTTADTMTGDGTGGGSMSINKTITTIASTPYTISIFAKASTATWLVIQGFDGSTSPRAWFNVSTGVVGIVEAGMSGGAIQSFGNGWYRCSVIRTTGSSSTSLRPQYGLGASDGVEATSATTALFLWGAQLEFGSTANTYIPTTTTAVYGTPTLSFSGVSTIGLESNGSLFVQPAGTGALQAQATTSTTAGGNARGTYAVDWQTVRNSAARVASATISVVSGGNNNTAQGYASVASGGETATASGAYSFVGGGSVNTASATWSTVVGGTSNTSGGLYNFIGGGFTNAGTSGSAVTTQSGTMNATTAVTLSGSNASIKVGQYITGTSIASDTYVAAISGTSLTLSKNASGSSTSTLSFFTPHGVVVGGGNNQATGSYSFIGGGGDAGTAANRNVASGDWSFVGGGWGHVASGAGGVVAGGGIFGGTGTSNGNTASGTSSGVLSGINNTASGTYAQIVGGRLNTSNGSASGLFGGSFGTTRSITGYTVFPASVTPLGTFAQGSSQSALLVLAKATTDATASALTSDGSAAGSTNQVILPNNSAYFFRGEVVSGVTGGGDTKGWTIEGVIKRGANAASTALVGTPTVTSSFADAGASTWTIAVTADTTNGGLRVTFTGQAATTIRTVCRISSVEMTY